ncbi:hypothetical protein FQR65_LT00093 [Abscondita terminalis]|nr:hypothetical protein FQR65_LT00093 [Abscondita terminalis]
MGLNFVFWKSLSSFLFNCIILSLLKNVVSILSNDESFRLPSSLQPLQYNLNIEPNLVNSNLTTFNGSVIIKVRVAEETNCIILHAQNLSIAENSVKVVLSNESMIKVNSTEIDNLRNFYKIYLSSKLPQSEIVRLCIYNFTGDLKFDNIGFYLAKYEELGKEEILALTDFQPIGARKAFPCFDEPALKAVFFISIIRPYNYTSLSNEELINTTYVGNGRFKDDFKETVPMSTYIVAFSVSKYKHTRRNGNLQIYGKASIISQEEANYALSVAPILLHTLENYTKVRYIMSKLDLFAVPSDYFEPGGMENWGLITISEENIGCTNKSTTEELQKCTMLIAHEIAHQWFGNLITPSWWKYYWLSEGFSTYLEYYITSLVNPSWEAMQYFVVNIQHNILQTDYLSSQHLNYNPQHAGTFPSLFISLGAAMIRMLQHVLTPDIFRLGVNIYLEQNKFSSVSPDQLYDALQQAVDEHNYTKLGQMTVKEIMDPWESIPGYPIVSVLRNYTDSFVTIFQENIDRNPKKNKRQWIIPINYLCSNENNKFNDTYPYLWLTNSSRIISDASFNCSWILFNNQQTGFYRVNYDIHNWNSLINFLKTPYFIHIHILNRAQLIEDSFQLAKLNLLSYNVSLNLSLYLYQETHYIPITSFLNNIKDKYLYFAYTKKLDIFLVRGVYNYLGFDAKPQDTHLDKITRANAITWLCNLGSSNCLNKSLVKLRNWVNDDDAIHKDVEFSVICGALKIGTTDDWNYVYEKFVIETNSNRRASLFASLGCTRNETLLIKFLDILLDSSVSFTIKVRQSALERILFLDNRKAEMVLNYFIKHQSVDNMYVKLQFPDILCKNIVRQNKIEVWLLLDPFNSKRLLMQSCLYRINRNFALMSQPDNKYILNWLESNVKHFTKNE